MYGHTLEIQQQRFNNRDSTTGIQQGMRSALQINVTRKTHFHRNRTPMFKKLFQSLKGGSSEKTGSTVAADPVTYKDVTIIATPISEGRK